MYGMFTEYGENMVQALVNRAKYLGWGWDKVLHELTLLGGREGTEEAYDTMVRESVYITLGFDKKG